MEQITTELIIKLIAVLLCFFWINWDFIFRRFEFWKAIKGKDGELQLTEACIYAWIRIFPVAVLSDLFFQLHLSAKVWVSLDAIFFTLILGDIGSKAFKGKTFSIKDKDDTTKDNQPSS